MNFIFLSLICIGIFVFFWNRYHFFLGLMAAYLVWSAFWVAGPGYAWMQAMDQAALTGLSMKTAILVLGSAIFLNLFKQETLIRLCVPIFGILCLIDSIAILIQRFQLTEAFYRVGILQNASMSACFIAMTWPFLLSYKINYKVGLVCLIPISAILFTHSSMGLVAFMASCLGLVLTSQQIRSARASWFVYGLVPGLMIGKLGTEVYRSNGRTDLWQMMMKWWNHSGCRLTGTGLGTFELFGPRLQENQLWMRGSWFIWMHNDYLQILFELGMCGLVLFLIIMGLTLQKSWKSPRLFAACLAFATTSMANFPVYVWPHGFFGLCLLFMAGWIKRGNDEQGQTRSVFSRH